MKEVYRNRDHALVGYYKTILESEGLAVMLRNEYASTGITEIPIPEFFPNICVLNDEDYEKAHKILNQVIHTNTENSNSEIVCPSCGEINPANFEICFSCENLLPSDH